MNAGHYALTSLRNMDSLKCVSVNALWGLTQMDSKTITLNSEEIEILSEIFGSLADLDFPISETPEYDALWDKIVSD